MKTQILFFALCLAAASFGRTVEIYYSQDGKKIESIRGIDIRADFTLSEEGDQSWLFNVGQKIGPNGYVPKENKLTLGALGKSRASFVTQSDVFLGFGHGRQYERPISFDDIAWIIPDTQQLAPVHVVLQDGTEGDLFVAQDYTESPGQKIIAGKPDNSLTLIQMKYNVSAGNRAPGTRPQQFGIKAKVISFSEVGIRKALRKLQF